MAVGDIPKIPREYSPRLQQLTEKLKNKEITVETLQENALSTLGRVTVSSEGVRFVGKFGAIELDREGLMGLIDSVKNAVPLWHMFIGRSFLYQQGDRVIRVRLGRIPRISRATLNDVENSTLPVIIRQTSPPHDVSPKEGGPGLPFWLKYLMDDPNTSYGAGIPSPPFKIRRVEELLGWFEDWEQLARVMNAGLPALPMTQKKRLDKLGENFPQLVDAFLKKCGV